MIHNAALRSRLPERRTRPRSQRSCGAFVWSGWSIPWKSRGASSRAPRQASMRCAAASVSTSRHGISTARLLDAKLLAEVYLELVGGRQPGLGLAPRAAAAASAQRPVASAPSARAEPRGACRTRGVPCHPQQPDLDSGLVAVACWRVAGGGLGLGAGGTGVVGGVALVELDEVDRLEKQRREAAVPGGVGNDAAGEGEEDSAGTRSGTARDAVPGGCSRA